MMSAGETGSEQGALGVYPDGGRSVWLLGMLVTFKAVSEETGGEYSLYETTAPPQLGAPPHIHHREDEAFYVLEGEYAFGGEGGEVRAGPGTLVHAPRGHLHWWRNVGEGPGRHLELFMPAGLEKLFEEIGETATNPNAPPSDPPDPRPLLESAPRYGLEFHLPDA